ncbi:MAG: glutathione S-transferase family protein [Burkholderiaceae bacterium]
MLVIYTVPVSLYCAKLRILLRHKSLDWEELTPPGGYGSDEYRRIVPSGNLPALIDGELTLGDSEAIAEYLNEKYPEPPMLPDDIARRALSRQRSRFHDTRLEPEVRALFPHLHPDNRDGLFVATQAERLNQRLGQLSRILDESAPEKDSALTLGDCGLPITCCWIDALALTFSIEIRWPTAVTKERQRLDSFTAVHEELVQYKETLAAYIAAITSSGRR